MLRQAGSRVLSGRIQSMNAEVQAGVADCVENIIDLISEREEFFALASAIVCRLSANPGKDASDAIALGLARELERHIANVDTIFELHRRIGRISATLSRSEAAALTIAADPFPDLLRSVIQPAPPTQRALHSAAG